MFTEDKFTDAREDCPHPEYWHAIDGQATEVEVSRLLANMVRTLQPDVVFETGTHIGATAEYIGRALKANGHGHLTTVEFDEELALQAGKNTRELPVSVILGDSLRVHPPENIDLLWLDSAMYSPGTEELHRVKEFKRLQRFLSPRAVVMIHDTGPHKPLRAALDELDVNWVHLPTPRGVSIGGQPR